MIPRSVRLVAALAIAITAVGVGVIASNTAGASSPKVKTVTLQGNTYTPKAPPGGTDDYHCTLVNPHLTSSSFIVSSQFFADSPNHEVHHAILFLVPPAYAAQARAADAGGKGWTCFGETALPGTFPTSTHMSFKTGTPWLAAWAPGVPKTPEPAGTGVPSPAGSMVIMQVHYNLLRGDKPVRVKLKLGLVPASTPLKPLQLDLMPAPPDGPCPSGVTGSLCNRTAKMSILAKCH